MKTIRRLGCLLLCALLLLSPARAGGKYPDLPEDHWAYAEMDRAVELGIINGVGEGYLAPEGTLTWGQYLAMIDRFQYPQRYLWATMAGLAWDQAGYWTAWDEHLIREEDFLTVKHNTLSEPILRQECGELLSRLLPAPGEDGETLDEEEPFTDWEVVPQEYRPGLAALHDANIARGRLDGSFDGVAQVTRAEGAVLLLRTLDYLAALAEPVPEETTPAESEAPAESETPMESEAPTESETPVERDPPVEPEDPQPTGEPGGDPPDGPTEDPWADRPLLREQWDNYEKSLLLFGDPEALRYTSREEAEAHIVTVTVPVWKLREEVKYPSQVSFEVHEALADEILAIFTEIFEDPEQFPIYEVGGYQWRGDKATGEHNTGTAVDVNPHENYQVYGSSPMTQGYWKPGEDPYSIPEDGSVVRIFRAHGWTWGGFDWVQFRGDYHDYMHFSFMGR